MQLNICNGSLLIFWLSPSCRWERVLYQKRTYHGLFSDGCCYVLELIPAGAVVGTIVGARIREIDLGSETSWWWTSDFCTCESASVPCFFCVWWCNRSLLLTIANGTSNGSFESAHHGTIIEGAALHCCFWSSISIVVGRHVHSMKQRTACFASLHKLPNVKHLTTSVA